MSAYLISPDAYCTFKMLFRTQSKELQVEGLFSKYKPEFELDADEIDLSKLNRIIQFIVTQMVIANSQNIYQMYDRPDNPMDVPRSQEEVSEYLQEGLDNRKWLRAVENNPQLIVKALN